MVAHCTAVHANDGNVFFKTELLIPVPHKTIFKIPVFYIHSHECSGRFADLMQRHEADAIALAQARPVQLDPHEHTVARAVRQPPVLRRAVVGEDRHLPRWFETFQLKPLPRGQCARRETARARRGIWHQ